eukprot:jgi/Botrbrau1/18740/Bobra.0386s0063.1
MILSLRGRSKDVCKERDEGDSHGCACTYGHACTHTHTHTHTHSHSHTHTHTHSCAHSPL